MSTGGEDTTAAELTDDNFIDLTIIDDSEITDEAETNEQNEPIVKVKIEPKSPEKNCQAVEPDSLILTADDEMFSVPNGKDSPQESKKTSDDSKSKGDSNKTDEDKDDKLKEQKKSHSKFRLEASSKNAGRSVWAMNVSRSSKASDLKQHFSKYARVSTAKIVTDGRSYYGFLSFETHEDAEKCMEKLNGVYFDNRKLKLSFTRPKLKSREVTPEKRKAKRKSHEKDSAPDSGKSKKKDKSPSHREKQLEKDYLREKRETERLKRRIQEQEEQIRLERRRQRQREEEKRELEWKLEMQKKKLNMEKEMFEKERKDLLRLEEVRRKIEEERLEVFKEKAKVKDTLRSVKKSESKTRLDTEKDDDKRRKANVKSKICDTSFNKTNVIIDRYSYRKVPAYDFPRAPPPPPKMSEIPKSKINRIYERRDEDTKKLERDFRKIETIHRDRRPDLEGRRERFLPRTQQGDGGMSQSESWKPFYATNKSWEVGQHMPNSGRFNLTYPPAAGYSSAPRFDGGGYCYHAPSANIEYPRYQAYSMHLERKY